MNRFEFLSRQEIYMELSLLGVSNEVKLLVADLDLIPVPLGKTLYRLELDKILAHEKSVRQVMERVEMEKLEFERRNVRKSNSVKEEKTGRLF